MRLLRTDTPELVLEDVDEDSKRYAILSHRWFADGDEISYQDLRLGTDIAILQAKKGWFKLEQCRKQASQDGLQYAWLDTCCIDKTSSQELTESINSMYRWYEKAAVCYVYLHDMPDPEPTMEAEASSSSAIRTTYNTESSKDPVSQVDSDLQYINDDAEYVSPVDIGRMEIELEVLESYRDDPRPDIFLKGSALEMFKACEWFQRGWTLQEMLAPAKLHFYTQSWVLLGDLYYLAAKVAKITHVHEEALTKERSIFSYSVAQRLSWAAYRRTTKIEDRAYSLLGLMAVNMGIIYGEGSRAFQRLQDEVLRTSSDHSIFVFTRLPTTLFQEGDGLLARSPDAFVPSGDVVEFPGHFSSYQILGNVVNITTMVIAPDVETSKRIRKGKKKHGDRFQAILPCCVENDPTKLVALLLETGYRGLSILSSTFLDIGEVEWQQCLQHTISLTRDAAGQKPKHGPILTCKRKATAVVMHISDSSNIDILKNDRDGDTILRSNDGDGEVNIVLTIMRTTKGSFSTTVKISINSSSHGRFKESPFELTFEGKHVHLAFTRLYSRIRTGERTILKRAHGRFLLLRLHHKYSSYLQTERSASLSVLEISDASILQACGIVVTWAVMRLFDYLVRAIAAVYSVSWLLLIYLPWIPIIAIYSLQHKHEIHLTQKDLHLVLGICIGGGFVVFCAASLAYLGHRRRELARRKAENEYWPAYHGSL